MQGGKYGRVHMLTYADHRYIAILYPRVHQSFFVKALDNQCVVGKLGNLAHLFFVGVKGEKICARVSKLRRKRVSEASEPHYTKGCRIFAFVVKHFILQKSPDGYVAFGIADPFASGEIPQSRNGQRTEPSHIHNKYRKKLAAC